MATKIASGKASGRRKRTKAGDKAATIGDFYGSVLDEAEQLALGEARKIDGLDEEIAVLRVKLRSAVKAHPEDLPLMLRGIGLLVKAVSARYRLSKQAEDDLADSLAGVIRGVGGILMPEIFASE